MIIYLLATTFISIAVGFGIMVHGVTHAPVGFEDNNGFHYASVSSKRSLSPSYAGPERRLAARSQERGAGRRYVGPLRRASDFNLSSGGNSPFLGGFA
jgi:hypothetical protein